MQTMIPATDHVKRERAADRPLHACCLRAALFSFLLLTGYAELVSQTASLAPDIKVHSIGNVRRMVTNGALSSTTYTRPVCEYPLDGGIENAIVGSPLIELAAATLEGDSLRYAYTQWWEPGGEPWDTIWVVRDNEPASIPFWQSYSGLGDEDFVYRCSNTESHSVTVRCPDSKDPTRLSIPPVCAGMHVSNTAWNFPPLNDVILSRYRIFPLRRELSGLFVSLYFRGGIGFPTFFSRYLDDLSSYFPDSHLSIVTDGGPSDGIESKNCVGYRIFAPPTNPPANVRWTTKDDFSRESALQCARSPLEYAAIMHGLLSSNVQMEGRVWGSNWIAVGPFSVPLGDTLEIWAAEILGQSVSEVIEKSNLVEILSHGGFVTPRPPPAPVLRVERASKSLCLRWDAHPGDNNPETYRDPGRQDGMEVPFEGYRLYRSTQGLHGPWTLLYECDIAANGFAHDVGLQHSFVETGLLNHAEYYYGVTAFSKPDTVTALPSRESPVNKAKIAAIPGEPAWPRLGEVAVVPNPYRSDIAYTAYDPPWEKPAAGWSIWTESERRVRFINLPRDCVISIYTLSGDLIQTLSHSDPILSFHNWNLTSFVGQAVASGIYLFAVKDKGTGEVQVGKFVVIR